MQHAILAYQEDKRTFAGFNFRLDITCNPRAVIRGVNDNLYEKIIKHSAQAPTIEYLHHDRNH
jgi:hypothetical protein